MLNALLNKGNEIMGMQDSSIVISEAKASYSI
jgi:hypothetical protein